MRTAIGVIVACATIAGCQSASAPQSGVRATAATAPADLQLLCASAASQQLGLPQDSLLPTASTASGNGYQVALTSAAGNATCEVRNDGTVVSVVRV